MDTYCNAAANDFVRGVNELLTDEGEDFYSKLGFRLQTLVDKIDKGMLD
jgi:hypothetical protein